MPPYPRRRSPRHPRGPRRPARRRSPRQRAGPLESGARARRARIPRRPWCRDCASTARRDPPGAVPRGPGGAAARRSGPGGAPRSSRPPARTLRPGYRRPGGGATRRPRAMRNPRATGGDMQPTAALGGRTRGGRGRYAPTSAAARSGPISGVPLPLGGCRSSLTGGPAASVSAEPAGNRPEPAREPFPGPRAGVTLFWSIRADTGRDGAPGPDSRPPRSQLASTPRPNTSPGFRRLPPLPPSFRRRLDRGRATDSQHASTPRPPPRSSVPAATGRQNRGSRAAPLHPCHIDAILGARAGRYGRAPGSRRLVVGFAVHGTGIPTTADPP